MNGLKELYHQSTFLQSYAIDQLEAIQKIFNELANKTSDNSPSKYDKVKTSLNSQDDDEGNNSDIEASLESFEEIVKKNKRRKLEVQYNSIEKEIKKIFEEFFKNLSEDSQKFQINSKRLLIDEIILEMRDHRNNKSKEPSYQTPLEEESTRYLVSQIVWGKAKTLNEFEVIKKLKKR